MIDEGYHCNPSGCVSAACEFLWRGIGQGNGMGGSSPLHPRYLKPIFSWTGSGPAVGVMRYAISKAPAQEPFAGDESSAAHPRQPCLRCCSPQSKLEHVTPWTCNGYMPITWIVVAHLCVPLESSTTFVRRVFIDSSCMAASYFNHSVQPDSWHCTYGHLPDNLVHPTAHQPEK